MSSLCYDAAMPRPVVTTAPTSNRWTALAVLTFARTAMGFQFQSVGAVSPLLVERLHISNADLGWLIGLFSLPGIVVALPGGLLGDRFGDRRVVLMGLSLMTVGSAVMGVAEGYSAVVVGRVISAAGAIVLNVLLTKMLADWFTGGEIVWAMAIMMNAWPVGIGIALFTLPSIAAKWGLPGAFHVAAGAAAVGALGIVCLYNSPPRTSRSPTALGLAALSRREIWLVAVAALPWMIFNVGFAVTLGFVPSLLVRAGLSMQEAGLLLGVTNLLFIVSVLAGGAAAQWLARPGAVVLAGLLAYAVGLAVLPFAPPWPTLLAVGLLGGLPTGTLVSAPTGVLRPESRGAGMGLFYTVYYIGMTLLPPVAGRLQDALGGSAAVYFAVVAISATLPCYLTFRTIQAAAADQAPLA